VQQLSARGVRVAVHYHQNKEKAEEVLSSLSGEGHILVQADLGDATACNTLWQEVISAFVSVDILINNAGYYANHPALTTDYATWQDEWNRTMATNLYGPANLTYLASNSMTAASNGVASDPSFGKGRIVNVSSRGAFRGEPTACAYGASKAGLNSLSQSMALAMAAHGVYIYCVAPGWVETDMSKDALAGPNGALVNAQHPLGRVASAAEVAKTCVFCALDAPAAMTGCVIDINGASYLRT